MSEDLDIPLRPTQETFVDEPSSLDDVGVDELVFDIEHNIKDINKLHVYHAITVFKQTLEDIIRLQQDEELFKTYRRLQLDRLGLSEDKVENKEEVDGAVDGCSSTNGVGAVISVGSGGFAKITSMSTPPERPDTPPCSPPLKFARLNENFNEVLPLRETTPDSLLDEGYRAEEAADNNGNESIVPQTIPIEDLLKSSNILESTEQNTLPGKHLETEIAYHSAEKIKQQNAHILKSFGLAKKPSLSIEEFLIRVQTYSLSISVLVYIHAAYMMFKLCVLLDTVPLTDLNVYRFILASIRCLTKKLEDLHQKQKAFATVGGVSQKDLFKIEVGFLYLINFKIVVGERVLQGFLKDEFSSLRKFVKDNMEVG